MTEEKKRMDVTNTNKLPAEEQIIGALAMGTTGYIEHQERAGQHELVTSDVLPYPQDRDDAPFLALGFTFGEARDDLFREATLPAGWTREGSDHAMWSYLLDADGYRRVAIFYKAAFYDRRADMHIERVPQTSGQADAYQAVYDLIGYGGPTDYDQPFWRQIGDRREGPNYVYVFGGCMGEIAAERDDVRYPHGGANTFADDGRRIEIIVAPDGSIIDKREFSVTAQGQQEQPSDG